MSLHLLEVIKMNVALYLGSFNPPHIGHQTIVAYLCELDVIDEVRVVVSPKNPLKDSDIYQFSFAQRFKLSESAFLNIGKKVKVTDIEIALPKPYYSINTIKYFIKEEPNNKFFLILGADVLHELELWYNWKELIKLLEIWIYPRKGYNTKELCNKYGLKLLDAPEIDISSSQIRAEKGIN